jgi:hypothetical protein
LVGHNLELVKELKIHTLKRINEYNKYGFIKEERFQELIDFETKVMDERIEVMSEWL